MSIREMAPRPSQGVEAIGRRAGFLAALGWMLVVGCAEDEQPPAEPGICDEGGGEDPYGSSMPRMDGNKLQLQVGHGGGCGHHDFAPCWDHMFADDGDLLVAALRVGHDAHGDGCEAFISYAIELDIEEIADAWRAETGLASGTLLVRVTLRNWVGAEPPNEEQTIEWVLE
jgi:hypothetical protein